MAGDEVERRGGWLRVLGAVLLGAFVFPCWLALHGDFSPSGHWGLLASAYPPTVELMRWAGAGVVAGLAAACAAPGWRWIIVPPLVAILEGGCWVVAFLVVGAGDVGVPQGTGTGMVLGVVLGALSPVAVGVRMSWAGRAKVVAAAALILLAVLAVSAWRGRPELKAMREDVLPAAERLLRTDVLTDAGPVQWYVVRRRMSPEGMLSVFAYGEVAKPRAQVSIESRDPRRRAGRGEELEGFSTDGFEIQIEVPEPHAEALISERECDRRTVADAMRAAGLLPDLVAAVVVHRYQNGAGCYATAVQHGVEYEFDWHTKVVYEFERTGYFRSMLIEIKGSYSLSDQRQGGSFAPGLWRQQPHPNDSPALRALRSKSASKVPLYCRRF